MTVSDLIDALESVRYEHGNIEVQIAIQPNWPLKARIANVTAVDGSGYIACREASEYAPREAWEE